MWFLIAKEVHHCSVAKAKTLTPASEVPKWAEVLGRWRKDFSSQHVEHLNLLNKIGLVGYEIASLRCLISRSMFFGDYKGESPDPSLYMHDYDKIDRKRGIPTAEKDIMDVTREEYEAMSDDEKKEFRKKKSERMMGVMKAVLPNEKQPPPKPKRKKSKP